MSLVGEIPVVAGLDQDPTLAICSADTIEMDADAGIVTVTRRSSRRANPLSTKLSNIQTAGQRLVVRNGSSVCWSKTRAGTEAMVAAATARIMSQTEPRRHGSVGGRLTRRRPRLPGP